MRIVVDTNVLVSALLNPFGRPAAVLGLILEEKVILCLDVRIISEYREVLFRPKFGFTAGDIEILLDFIRESGQFFSAHAENIRLSHTADIPFAQVCLASGARYLITGNIDHFPKRIGRTTVVAPARFLEKYYSSDSKSV